MKKYSENTYEFKSRLSSDEIIGRLKNRTLKKETLAMVLTDKDFIGRIEHDSFSIIDSTYPLPYGAACVLKGTITPDSQIILTTTLHKAFRILFLVWIIVVTTLFLTFWILDSARIDGLFAFVIGMPIIAILLRLFLHAMYALTRNKALKKVKRILEAVD